MNSRNYCSNWSHSVFLNFSYSLRCVYNFSIILLLDYFISPKLTFLHLFLTFIITFFSCFLLLFSLLAGSNETKVEKYISFGLENLENWTWIFWVISLNLNGRTMSVDLKPKNRIENFTIFQYFIEMNFYYSRSVPEILCDIFSITFWYFFWYTRAAR